MSHQLYCEIMPKRRKEDHLYKEKIMYEQVYNLGETQLVLHEN